MKRTKYIIAMIVACMFVCFTATGCTDSEFNAAAKQQTTVKYIAIDKDLNLVSNFIERRNLKDAGLKSNAYFIYGTAKTIYFAVAPNDPVKESTVYAYDIEEQRVNYVLSKSGERSTGMLGYKTLTKSLVYVAMPNENIITFVYSIEKQQMFKTEYNFTIENYDRQGNSLGSKEFGASRLYPILSSDKGMPEEVVDLIGNKSDCYWDNSSGRKYDFIYPGGKCDINSLESSDAIWSIIHGERENTSLDATQPIIYPVCGSYAAFGMLYTDSAQKHRIVYFCTDGRQAEYLFTESNTALRGLYVIK